MSTSRLTIALFAGAGLALLAAAPASAQEMEQTYKDYQAGIYAQELCTKTEFGQDEYGKLSEALDKKVNYELGAGRRLFLIEEMKPATKKLVQSKGCDSEEVQALLTKYQELASAQ